MAICKRLVEDDPPQVDVVHGADQEDHIEVSAHEGNMVHFRDGAQLLAQFAPRMLTHLQGYVGR